MVVLGIDPGYAIVGYGIVKYENNRFSPITFGAVTTKAGERFSDRLEKIYDENGEEIENTAHSMMKFSVPCEIEVKPLSILRKLAK